MSYPAAIQVLIIPTGSYAGQPYRDEVGGLNGGHALYRARQQHPAARVLAAAGLRWTEVELSECAYGCKIQECEQTGHREIFHSSTYGCPLGRHEHTTWEPDAERTRTPGGRCTYCGGPGMIRHHLGLGWICHSTCV